VCTHTRARARIRTQTHTYTGWPESGVSLGARATRSIRHVASCASTPRNVGAPLPRCPYLSSLSLSLFLSAVSAPLAPICSGHPSTTWPTCSPTPEERDDTVETGFRAGRRFGGGNTPFSRIFRHALARTVLKKERWRREEGAGGPSRHSREYPQRTATCSAGGV